MKKFKKTESMKKFKKQFWGQTAKSNDTNDPCSAFPLLPPVFTGLLVSAGG